MAHAGVPSSAASFVQAVTRFLDDRHQTHRGDLPAPADIYRLGAREERPPRTHLHAAHLAGAAAAGGQSGGAAGDAAARSRATGGAAGTARPDSGASSAGRARRWREAGNPGRDSALGAREPGRDRCVPSRDPGGLRRKGAQGVGSVRGWRRDPPRSDAARLRGGRGGPQSGGVVRPALHAALPAAAGWADTAVAGIRRAGSRLRHGVPASAGREEDAGPAAGAGEAGSRGRGAGAREPRRHAGTGVAGGVGGSRVASACLGGTRARRRAAGAGGALPDVRRVRAGNAEGEAPGQTTGAEALPAPAAATARARCGRADLGRRPERGVRLALPGARRQSALGRKAGGRLSLGANGPLRRLPGGDSITEDALALQEGSEACPADDDAA